MGRFKNAIASHEHSRDILDMIYGYDTFLDSVEVVADMGCGQGLDAEWWATLATRDDPPAPHNYLVYAIDQDIAQIEPDILDNNENIKAIAGNFEERIIPRKVDLIWAHDSFQYARDPFKCLATWKATLNTNGMLLMAVPQTTYLHNNRLTIDSYSDQPYSYNVLNLIYMLAVSGFDCRDAYFYRKENTPWLYAGVYASEHDPLAPDATWYALAERNLINDSVVNSMNRHGHVRLEDILVTWLDKNLYQITN